MKFSDDVVVEIIEQKKNGSMYIHNIIKPKLLRYKNTIGVSDY